MSDDDFLPVIWLDDAFARPSGDLANFMVSARNFLLRVFDN